jgi:hypothetical protein
VTEFLLILFRWMVAIPGRAERVLKRGCAVLREQAASPDGSDGLRRLAPAWIDRERSNTLGVTRRRRGWMTYCLGRERMGVLWELVPWYELRRHAQPYLFEPIPISSFLCSERVPRRRAAPCGTLGRMADLSIARNRPLIYREF